MLGDLLYAADAHSASNSAAARATRRAKSAMSRTSRSPGELMTGNGRTSCCFNLRLTACLCATSQGFAGDLGGVIEDCVFSRAMVNAKPISGPNPTERNKMERYRRCRSAAATVGPTTAEMCSRSARRAPWTRHDAFLTPQRSRRPVTATSRLTSAPATSGSKDEPRRVLKPLDEMIPRLYRTYGYQFTSSYRRPVSQFLPSVSPPSRPAGGEASDDETTTASAVHRRATMQSNNMQVRRGDHDRTSMRSLKPVTSSPIRHDRLSRV